MKKLILLALLLCCSSFALAGNELPFNATLKKEINERFLVDGEVSSRKLDTYVLEVEARRDEVTAIVRNFYKKYKGKKKKKVEKEIAKDDAILTYNLVLGLVEDVRSEHNIVEAQLMLEKILELDDSAKSFGRLPIVARAKKRLSALRKSNYFIKREAGDEGEASNLYNPRTGEFFSQDEIRAMIERGEDISLLEPNPKSRFWRANEVEGLNIIDHSYTGAPLFKGIDLEFPKSQAMYKEVRKSQTKPKFEVNFNTVDKRTGKNVEQKYKLKLGAEVHSEITAGFLAASLGFHADASKFEKEFKMILPKGTTLQDVEREWRSYYNTYDFDKYVKETGKTDKGLEYVILKDVLVEAKPKGLNRIGRWSHGSFGHKGQRELRGFFIFNAWIANIDLKESDNNKIILRDNEQGEQEMFQFTHDLGGSFGHYLRESPNNFRWILATPQRAGAVHLDFRQFQVNSGFDHVTYHDARWMVRKIAKLSREQIKDAVEHGGWPESAGKLIVEKLISRRNNLVESFELESEIDTLYVERNLTTDDGVVVNGEYFHSKAPEHSVELKGDLAVYGDQFKAGIERLSIASLVKLGSSTSISIDTEALGLDRNIFTKIEYKPNRIIERNLNQTGDDDYFLVHDSLRVEFSLGVGVVARGSVGFVRDYRISYTVKEYDDAIYNKNFIVDLFLNKTIENYNLPKQSIVTIGQGFVGEGFLRFRTGLVGIRARAGVRAGNISYTTLARKGDKFLVSKERGKFYNIFQELDFLFVILKYSIFSNTYEEGIETRRTYKLEFKKNVSEDEKVRSSIYNVLFNNNLNSVKQFGKEVILRSNYVEKTTRLNLLLWNRIKHSRSERVSRKTIKKDGSIKEAKFYQLNVGSSYSRSSILSGEFKSEKVQIVGKIGDDGEIKSPAIRAWITIDDLFTESHELQEYISKINLLALDKKFLDFDVAAHTKNNYWDKVNVDVRMMYTEKAVNKLLNTSEDEFFKAIAEKSNRDVKFWSSRVDNDIIDKNSRMLRSVYRKFVKHIVKAKKTKDSISKFKIVAKALNSLITKQGESFAGILLQRVHAIVGIENLYLEAHISTPSEFESKLVSGLDLYNHVNPKLKEKIEFFEFDREASLELWTSIMGQI